MKKISSPHFIAGDVIKNGITINVVVCRHGIHIAGGFANDESKFRLRMHTAIITSHNQRLTMSRQTRSRFQEKCRMLRG